MVDGKDWVRAKWKRYAKVYLYLTRILAYRVANVIIFDNVFAREEAKQDHRYIDKKSFFVPYGADYTFKENRIKLLKKYGLEKRKYYYFDDSTLHFISRMFQNRQVCQCHSGLQSAFINWDGEVYACEVFNQRRFSFGNIKENPFDEIWNSNKAREIRKYIKEGKCQPCYLACEIIPSLRKDIFPTITYTCKRRLVGYITLQVIC
jgi:radical SAM protein with 4Fe4S-binding SPASM domain